MLVRIKFRAQLIVTRSIGGVSIDQADYNELASLLQKCIKREELLDGRRVHQKVVECGYHRDKYLGNLLIQMYGNCGDVAAALQVFESIVRRNVYSWNLVLGAFLLSSQLHEARRIFNRMPQRDVVTCDSMITAFARTGHLELARATFDEMRKREVISWNAVVAAYAQNLEPHEAMVVFERMPQHTVVSWTAIVAAYARNGHLEEAHALFQKMPQRNDISWSAMIAAYAETGKLKEATLFSSLVPMWCVEAWNALLHAYSQSACLDLVEEMFHNACKRSLITWNIMIQAYARCKRIADARTVFDKMPEWVVVTYNLMITAYAQAGQLEEATSMFKCSLQKDVTSWNAIVAENGLGMSRKLFELMPQHNVVSWTAMVGGYAQNGHEQNAKLLFDKMPSRNSMSWTVMVQALSAQKSNLAIAELVFERMPQRHLVSWNIMLQAYATHGFCKEAFKLFSVMDLESVEPDEITYLNLLEACTNNTSPLAEERLVVEEVVRSPFSSNEAVRSCLVNACAKCGYLQEALSLFSGSSNQNLISWSSMVGGYALNGHHREAVELFRTMSLWGTDANDIVFVNLLTACRHGGLLQEGWKLFMLMRGEFGIEPTFDHYVCMVDLLGRGGRLEEAENLIQNMPFEPSPAAWMALFGASKRLGDTARQAQAGRYVSKLDPLNKSRHIASVLSAYL